MEEWINIIKTVQQGEIFKVREIENPYNSHEYKIALGGSKDHLSGQEI